MGSTVRLASDDDRRALAAASLDTTLPGMFAATLHEHGDRVALRHGELTLTWAQYAAAVERAVSGLRARGVGPGDRVLLLLRNVPAFFIADLALSHLGACPISIYNSSAPAQIEYIARHSGATLAIAETRFVPRVVAARDAVPDLRTVIEVPEPGPGDADWEDVLAAAATPLQALAPVDPRSLATIIYTSGATGPPKGVMLTHANLAWQTAAMLMRMEGDTTGWRAISYLPMAHIGERMMGHYLAIRGAMDVTCCEDPADVGALLARVRPQIFLGMPRMWEKLHAVICAAGPPGGDERRAALTAAGLGEGQIMLSGGGVLSAEVHEAFRALGLPLSDIYGMSESTGPITWSPRDPVPGTVGRPMPGCDVRIEYDGEIVFRSGSAFAGYLADPQRTAETDAGDGWVRTGDLGRFAGALLTVTGRKKELIVTAGGKNVSPANLESALKAQPLIAHAAVVGEGRPFVGALVVLDRAALGDWAQATGTTLDAPDVTCSPAVQAAVADAVREAGAAFSQSERVRVFRILDADWLPDSDELTPTAKLKRHAITAKYADDIELLYATARPQGAAS